MTGGQVEQLRNLDAFSRLEAETLADQRGIEVEFAEEAGAGSGLRHRYSRWGLDWLLPGRLRHRRHALPRQCRLGRCRGGEHRDLRGRLRPLQQSARRAGGIVRVSPTGGWQDWQDSNAPSRRSPTFTMSTCALPASRPSRYSIWTTFGSSEAQSSPASTVAQRERRRGPGAARKPTRSANRTHHRAVDSN